MAKDDKKVLLVAQEIKLVKILAGNNNKLRERTIKRLSKWLTDRTSAAPLTEEALMRIWKGLFYAMWMSDKPLIQEDCAEKIANLIHVNDVKVSLLFFKCFLQTMVNEWYGIDHHRIDKFLMLIRRVFRQTFQVLHQNNWPEDCINQFREILNQTALKIDKNTALSLCLHIDDIFLEELAKVSKGKLNNEMVLALIQPFAQQLARVDDKRQHQHIVNHIFKHLINQTDIALEYKEKFRAWKRQGFPGGTIDSMESVPLEEDDDDLPEGEDDLLEEEDDFPKDPRAGKVDVILPQIQFDPLEVVRLLEDIKFKKYTTSSGRKTITKLIKQFKLLAEGVYPLGLTKIQTFNDGYSTSIKSSIKRLHNFEQTLTHDSKKSKSKALKRKRAREIALEQVEQLADTKNEETDTKNGQKHSKNDQKLKNKSLTNGKLNKNALDQVLKQTDTINEDKHITNEQKHTKNEHKPTKKQKKSHTVEELIEKGKVQKYIPIKSQNHFKRNSGIWTVDEYEVPESPKPGNQHTHVSEWEKPLKNGETEIFVVSKKSKKKLKRLADATNRPVGEIVDNFTQKILNSTPQKSKIVPNPFSENLTPKTPKSEKKIKFSSKIQAQEFTEHEMQLITSPVIPFDATRRPTKGLLKPSPYNSPINPFYNLN